MGENKRWGWRWALSSCVLVLAACGGSSSVTQSSDNSSSNANGPAGSTALPVSKVYVMGDNWADVGTYGGVQYTVTNEAVPATPGIYPLQVASGLGLNWSEQCSFYRFDGSALAPNPTAGCTNYAIGGAQVFHPSDAADPRNITTQLAARASAGMYAETDLVLIQGGVNDLAELVDAYMTKAENPDALNSIFSRMPPPSADDKDAAERAPEAYYMWSLAKVFYDAIKLHVLDNGAKRVIVLNIPDITLTPRFKNKLEALPTTEQADVQKRIQVWAEYFNIRLLALSQNQVAMVRTSEILTGVVGSPVKYGLSNAHDPVCTVDAARGKFPCLSSALDQTAGRTAGWWKTHVFADDFNPTPATHQLVADDIMKKIKDGGWR